MSCIGEPISWLRLERHHLAADPQVAAHLDACVACRAAMAEITGDLVALPALVVPERAKRRWWLVAIPALAAAAIAVVIVRPRAPERQDVATIKGVGEVVLDVARERDGVVRDDVRSFRPGDRWKVIVTCPPRARAVIDVAVVEDGARTADYPLAPAPVACGNRVVVPGAFALTGVHRNRVCVRVAADAAPARSLPRPGDEGVACLTIAPE